MKYLMIIAVFGMIATGCSRKAVPTIYTDNPCDSLIQTMIDSIKNVKPVLEYREFPVNNGGEIPVKDIVFVKDTSTCNYYMVQALQFAKKYNEVLKERDFYKKLSESRARKIINNVNINSRNKDTQIGDSNIKQDGRKAPNIVGNGNVAPVKPKANVVVGDGNKVTSGSFNPWPWILIGFMICYIMLKLVVPAARRYVPILNVIPNWLL